MQNPDLPTLFPGYAGNTFRHGRFVERYMSTVGRSFWPVLKWNLSRNPKRRAKREDSFRLVVQPLPHLPPPEVDCLVWLGHASFLLRAAGRTLLLDPVLKGPRFLRRLAAVPLDVEALAVDYVLVSHGHYDHLDLPTLRSLGGPSVEALVPLRLGGLVKQACPSFRVQEAGWYQAYDTGEGLRVTLVPAQHWHRRGLNDYNAALWGGFRVDWGGRSLFFAGDTGYNGHFREIREHLGPVDLALLPIGAYDPPSLMRPSHMNPEEALQAFRDLEGGTLVPMHYGTFDLSDEPIGEPLRRLRAAWDEAPAGALRVLDVGEVVFL
jgi:L-ascorbate metabolism protein UlaG (beta-lactamase superfamily)